MRATSSLSIQLKQLLVGKKSKLTIYVIGVLWIAVIMQIAVNTMLRPESNILEAFVSTNSEVSSFELEMEANYGNRYLSESDKKELLLYVANQIGLSVDKEVTINNNGDESEVYAEKNGKNAETLLKVVSIKKENTAGLTDINHYLMVNLKLYKNMDSVLKYRDLLKKVFRELDAKDIQITMQLSSKYKGKLSLDNMNKIADSMISNLQGKVAYENRKENLFTIYAYSGLLDEYVTSLGTKINIHVAINYDELTDSTNVYLGTPVINGGY
ncbi:MAG: YwmB family TATA-box binding protein [Anaerocolumna sp.]